MEIHSETIVVTADRLPSVDPWDWGSLRPIGIGGRGGGGGGGGGNDDQGDKGDENGK